MKGLSEFINENRDVSQTRIERNLGVDINPAYDRTPAKINVTKIKGEFKEYFPGKSLVSPFGTYTYSSLTVKRVKGIRSPNYPNSKSYSVEAIVKFKNPENKDIIEIEGVNYYNHYGEYQESSFYIRSKKDVGNKVDREVKKGLNIETPQNYLFLLDKKINK